MDVVTLAANLSVAREEIAGLLRGDHGEVQDKIVEIGRACRVSAAPNSEPARVFEDRKFPGRWRVEWVDDDGGCEVAIFSGPNARERAIRYADRPYRHFEEGTLVALPIATRTSCPAQP